MGGVISDGVSKCGRGKNTFLGLVVTLMNN